MLRSPHVVVPMLFLLPFMGILLLGQATPASAASPVDVVFAFDCTGSMGGVIDTAKARAVEIMNRVAELAPDCAFGVVSFSDYPGYYTSYGYSAQYGGYGDYAYRTETDVITEQLVAAAAMYGLYTHWGADGPQDYARVLWETTQPYDPGNAWGITWRPGARRIVVLFGDAPAHDDDLFSRSFGGDPGRDGIMFTADDLDYQGAIQQVAAAGITVLSVDCTKDYCCPYSSDAHYNFGVNPSDWTVQGVAISTL